MPGLVENSAGCRVLCLPQPALKDGAEGSMKMLKLKHPRTGGPSLYLINTASNALYEIMEFKEEHRTWFIGERIVEDGTLMVSTPVDPTFIILPYLISAERNVPLEDLLDDVDFPHLQDISKMSSGLRNVSDQLGDAGLNVWKYNEEKCLAWLQNRVQAVSKVLREQQIDLSEGAAAHSYKQQADTNSVEYTRYALGIVSQYLPADLLTKLEEKLNLPKAEKRQSDATGGPPAKKQKTGKAEPAEDYSQGVKKGMGKEKELTAKEKALKKSSVGTKSITSFFSKK